MDYIIIFFSAVLLGILSSVIPGLLNMNAVKISQRDGKPQSYRFVLGACLIIALEIFLTGFLIHHLGFKERFMGILRKAGLIIFVILTIYFFFAANHIDRRKAKKKEESETYASKNHFVKGLGLASANLFPIPFYLILFALLKSYRYPLDLGQVGVLAAGVFLGTGLMFVLYIRFFSRSADRLSKILHNINYIIGGITGLVSLITLYRIMVS